MLFRLPTLLALSPSPRAPFPVCVSRGDVVEIIKDVSVKGEPAKGMVGEVIEDLEENDAEEWGACCEVAWGEPTLRVELRPTVTGYFAENEVKRISAAKTMDLVEGDRIIVTEDVQVRGRNSNGWEGTVTDVWTGCETDPPCCCNELATEPLTVRLEPPPAEGDALVGLFSTEEVRVLSASRVL